MYGENFAVQICKNKANLSTAQKHKTDAESMRDMFIHMIIFVAEKTPFDLEEVLSCPNTTYPCHLHTVMGLI